MAAYSFAVGDLQCVVVEDGRAVIPVDNMVRNVPPETWKGALGLDTASPGEMPFSYNYLYVRTAQHHVLVDAGLGPENPAQDEAFEARYKMRLPKVQRNGSVVDHLQAQGVASGDVSWVILTHGDRDHVGGLVDRAGQPVFPRARYVMLREAWDFWNDQQAVARWPEFMTSFGRQILPTIREQVTAVEAGVEFLPGFALLPAPGHRPGHAAVSMASAGQELLHVGDTVAHPVFMEHPAWQWAVDSDPAQAQRDREWLLGRAAERGALVAGSHLPFPGVGRLVPLAEGWRWQPLD
ncbi:MAG TPA: MBL fold metallo-hydrolase [Anaerolineae bacterium]|nr:MBL fold metallo-hydrolase [Anaerolineae bacterium]